MGITPPGAGPRRGGGGGYGESDGGQPPSGESGGLCADGGGQWPSPGTAQHQVSVSLGAGALPSLYDGPQRSSRQRGVWERLWTPRTRPRYTRLRLLIPSFVHLVMS